VATVIDVAQVQIPGESAEPDWMPDDGTVVGGAS